MNRSQLNGFRATTGLGQGSVRNANTRSNDKMAGYNSFPQPQSPVWENPGMQQEPLQPQQQQGGFQQQPPPDVSGSGGYSGPVKPQFTRPDGMLPQSGYNRFANRFAAAGGNVAAPPSWAPQNPLLAQRRPRPQGGPVLPAPPPWKPEDGNINPPPPNNF